MEEFFSLDARILEIILYQKFNKLMGLKSANRFLGIRAMKKAFVGLKSSFVLKKCWTA